MRAKFIRSLLLLLGASAGAVAFALAAASHEPSDASAPLRMPAQTGRTVVTLRPAPGRPESSPGPIVHEPAVPTRAHPHKQAVAARPRPRARVVIVPGVILTRADPTPPRVKVIPVPRKVTPPAPTTRELAQVEAELAAVHDRPAPPRPHE
jgi:hypothetical protein